MSRLHRVAALYEAAASVTNTPGAVELVAVSDELGARFDFSLRELLRAVPEDSPGPWAELLMAARQLRWRMLTEPFPGTTSPDRESLVAALKRFAQLRRLGSGEETAQILDNLMEQADASRRQEAPSIGEQLVSRVAESGRGTCTVILSSHRAAEWTREWFRALALPAEVVSAGAQASLDVRDRAYLVGPPAVFGPSALAAPRTRSLTYLFPSWVRDRSLPTSRLSDLAEGGIRPRARLRTVGPDLALAPSRRQVEDQVLPSPAWNRPTRTQPPGEDEVLARRILLAGGYAMMIETGGELIRTLDPRQPPGERIEFRDVEAVAPGTFLVAREGQTESEALYDQAIAKLGTQGSEVERSQQRWKSALRQRLVGRGRAGVIRDLQDRGVRAARQAPAWTARTVARPQRETDFQLLLDWLGLHDPSLREHANLLRRARSMAVADVREALEGALGEADIVRLEREGAMRLELALDGFASIMATRVLAISPYEEVVHRHEVRMLKEEATARWLE